MEMGLAVEGEAVTGGPADNTVGGGADKGVALVVATETG